MPRRLTPFDLLLFTGAMLLGFLLLGPVLTIPLRVPLGYNEGWNAGFDARAMRPGAGPLYPGPDSLVFNNYPPLGFLIVGAAGRYVFGDMIVAGRALALAGLLGSAGLGGLCVRQLGGSRRAAAAAALLMLLFACSFYRGYVAMDDPQWLAHALMLGGLALLLRGGAVRRLRTGGVPGWQVAAAALLMVAGGFVKHNLLALPAAATLWLFWTGGRAGLVWIGAAAACAGVGLLATEALFGQAALAGILHHRRILRPVLLLRGIAQVAPLLPTTAILVVLLRRRQAGEEAVLVALFAAGALVAGIVQRMGEGVNYNAHFEALIALCLGFGLAVTPAPGPAARRRPLLGPAWLCAVAAMPVIGGMPWFGPAAWHDIADRTGRQAAWQPVIARLARSDGPAGCDMPSICIWAGKPFSVDVFNLTQSVLAGGPIAPFRSVAARHGFGLFERDPASSSHREAVRRLGWDPVGRELAGRYVAVATGPGGVLLLAPRPAPSDGQAPAARAR